MCVILLLSSLGAGLAAPPVSQPVMQTNTIATGLHHILIVMADGSLWAWEDNTYEQLGNSKQTIRSGSFKIIENNNQLRPVKIMENIVFILAGTEHNLAIKADGSLWGWGNSLVFSKRAIIIPERIMDGVKLPGSATISTTPATSTPPITTAASFPDVPSSHWAYSSIMLLAERGVISGYTDGTFKPNDLVTRSEFAKMMTLTLNIPLLNEPAPSFVDVARDEWEFSYVESAKKYLTGYQLGESYFFKGKEEAVREDMAVALVKVLKLENEQVSVNELENIFTDHATISPELRKYVLIAYKNQLISGYLDKTFGAQKPITRAETATLLVKVLSSAALKKVTFDDDTAAVNPSVGTNSPIPSSSYFENDNGDAALLFIYKEKDSLAVLPADGKIGMGYPDGGTFAFLSTYATNSPWIIRISRGGQIIAEQQFEMSNDLLVINDTWIYNDANFTFTMADFVLTAQQRMLIEQSPFANGKLEALCFAFYPADKSLQERLFYMESLKLNY
jgi:hypothetical protein